MVRIVQKWRGNWQETTINWNKNTNKELLEKEKKYWEAQNSVYN